MPWEGVGTDIHEENNSDYMKAILEGGLAWEVLQDSVYTNDGKKIPGYKLNYRMKGEVFDPLGIVKDGYRIVQNWDAVSFTQKITSEGGKFDTVGEFRGGKRIWVSMKLPSQSILGETTELYLLVTNGHDGRHAIKCAVTPVRTLCQNIINIALSKAKRSWSTNHIGDIQAKIVQANTALSMTSKYMDALKEEAEILAEIKVDQSVLAFMIAELFPLPKEKSHQRLVNRNRQELIYRYGKAPDLARFRGTGWGLLNAVSDYIGHRQPMRTNAASASTRLEKIIGGDPLLDNAYSILTNI
jgi:phage/plasmid-like protein (TIGR03299 family)